MDVLIAVHVALPIVMSTHMIMIRKKNEATARPWVHGTHGTRLRATDPNVSAITGTCVDTYDELHATWSATHPRRVPFLGARVNLIVANHTNDDYSGGTCTRAIAGWFGLAVLDEEQKGGK